MHPSIRHQVERPRGCGYRKLGGIYLVTDVPSSPCGKLPIPLDKCPTCGHGIHPSRGWTWVNGRALTESISCAMPPAPLAGCRPCPLDEPPCRVGLLWVGEVYYKTAEEFSHEARNRGISRRIAGIPHGFNLIGTWVYLAHRKAVHHPQGPDTPGVFEVFKPARVEIIVTGEETDEDIERLLDRGLTPVKVTRDVDHTPLFRDPSTN